MRDTVASTGAVVVSDARDGRTTMLACDAIDERAPEYATAMQAARVPAVTPLRAHRDRVACPCSALASDGEPTDADPGPVERDDRSEIELVSDLVEVRDEEPSLLIGRQLVDVSEQDERRLVASVTGKERTKVRVARDDDPVVGSRGLEDRVIGCLTEIPIEDVHCVMAGRVQNRDHAW
jgi:hypothetical protein